MPRNDDKNSLPAQHMPAQHPMTAPKAKRGTKGAADNRAQRPVRRLVYAIQFISFFTTTQPFHVLTTVNVYPAMG